MQAQFCACSMGELLYGLMPNASRMKKKKQQKTHTEHRMNKWN